MVFCLALLCTYALQYTLLRHVLLRVILHLEGIKVRRRKMIRSQKVAFRSKSIRSSLSFIGF